MIKINTFFWWGQGPKISRNKSLGFRNLLVFILIFGGISISSAQLAITESNASLDAEALVETIFLGDGVEVTNITYTGDSKSVGFFNDGLADIGLDRGLMISSGFVVSANDAETVFAGDMTSGPNNDVDLDNIATLPIDDVAKYEITFIPTADTLRFRYVFASEEYPGFNCSNFNDIFGFFISGPNPAGGTYNAENIALVPDVSDPSGLTFTTDPVTIANVHGAVPPNCPGANEQYYNINIGSQNLAYGAYLDVFTAQAIVIPCQEYVMKLAICDVGDANFDSSVFLEAKSFGTGTVEVNISTVSLDGSIAEGCNSGTIVISLPNPVDEDFIVDAQIIDCDDSATQNVDYTGLPDQIIIPAGESRVEYEVFAIEDFIDEGTEYICFDIQRDICNRDTIRIGIAESQLTEVFIPNDTMICQNETVFLVSDLPQDFVLPPSPSFSSSTNVMLTDELETYEFDINVSGVAPDYLAQGLIQSICIDTIESVYLTDMDIFIVTPSGAFMELSTDNGFKPMNGADIDYMISTCFTPSALLEVENGNSLVGPIYDANPTYTGEFLPEGIWTDLYGESRESNGEYKLLILDDEAGAIARFTGWTINFNALYNLTYEWSSDVTGFICENCTNLPVVVGENTTFYLKVTDSYGCEYIDSFFVEVVDLLPQVENMVCDSVSPNFIRIEWDAEAQATGYEIFVPGVIDPAVNIGNVTEWAISGLNSVTDYEITITVIGGPCGGESTTITCTTNNCEVDPLITEELDGVSCFGLEDGVLDVLITGNFPPFDYEFRGMNDPDGSFSNLAAGEDTLYITDLSGCISKYVIDIPTPLELNVDFEDQVGISCFGELDGRVTAEPFGGTAPYEFLWESGEVTAQAVMLGPGWNSVTITDFNLCEIIDSIEFIIPLPIFATHLFQDAECFGDPSGMAILNPMGGTVNSNDDYGYAWGDAMNQTTVMASDLLPGTYIVTITDLNSCTGTEEVIIGSPPEIETSVAGSQISCFNSIDGEALVTIQGGNAPFEFLWDNGEMVNPAINLTAGMHFVTITDNNDCSTVDSVIIIAPPAIEVTFNNSNVSCFDGSDGQISWNVIGGTGMITVTDELGNVLISPIDLIPSNEYCFSFTDDQMCVLDTCVTISEPERIVITGIPTEESCFDSNDAAIDISVVNATEPITYTWTGPNAFSANSEDIVDVNSGTYGISIEDGNGCISDTTFFLLEPNEITLSAEVLNIACKNQADGIINITVIGGTMPFEYSWIGPNGFTSDQEDLVNVFAGTYTLIFEDANDCIVQKSYEIIEPALGVQSNISLADEVCFNKVNGVASINPFGGTLPYSVIWSTGSQFNNINGLAPDWYFVTITDGSGCSIIDSVEVIERPEIIVNTTQTPSLCFESLDGNAEVSSITVNGQDQDLDDYTYLWNSFPLQTTADAVNLKGGQDYLVIVTDDLGCTAQAQVVIETPEEVTATLEMVDSISCALGDDGSIVIQGRGGNAPFEYQWGQAANFQVGAAAKSLKAGTYSVTITDSNQCTGVEEFEIRDPFPISLNFRVFDVLCFGDESGEVEIIANGGTEPYNYNWSNGNQTDQISALDQGQFILTVTDSKGCEVVDSVIVNEPLEPLGIDLILNNVTCADGSDGSIVIDASGGSGNYIYSLDNFIYNGSIEQIGLSEGIYTVYVKDANGCIDSIDNIDIFSPAPLQLELGPDVYLSYGETFQFDPNIQNFQAPMIFSWVSPDNDLLSCDDCRTPFFDAIKQATYRLVVTDARGCIVDDFINIYIENGDAIFVPTGFTPNGDFTNDILNVYGQEGVMVNSFRVFDRWGEKMFEAENFLVNDTSIGWDGNFHTNEMPPGTYTWVIEAEFTNGFKQVYSGNTTLIK